MILRSAFEARIERSLFPPEERLSPLSADVDYAIRIVSDDRSVKLEDIFLDAV